MTVTNDCITCGKPYILSLDQMLLLKASGDTLLKSALADRQCIPCLRKNTIDYSAVNERIISKNKKIADYHKSLAEFNAIMATLSDEERKDVYGI